MRFCQERKQLLRRQTEAIPGSTRQKGKTPFLASLPALRTQQLVVCAFSNTEGSFTTATGAGAPFQHRRRKHSVWRGGALFNTTGSKRSH
jgi:hypothetical protein